MEQDPKEEQAHLQMLIPRSWLIDLHKFAEEDGRSFVGEIRWILREYIDNRNRSKRKKDGV